MGAEGADDLAGKVIVLQEGIDRHGHGAAVVGVAQIDAVIARQIFRQTQQLRTDTLLPVGSGLRHAGAVVVGIGVGLTELQQVAAGEGRQLLRHPPGVAHRDAAVGAAEVVLSRTGVVSDQNSHIKDSFLYCRGFLIPGQALRGEGGVRYRPGEVGPRDRDLRPQEPGGHVLRDALVPGR